MLVGELLDLHCTYTCDQLLVTPDFPKADKDYSHSTMCNNYSINESKEANYCCLSGNSRRTKSQEAQQPIPSWER